ncbi:hypothetical protein AGOR_G00251660 [Albula goreensis]|uniref:Uncharacterized protein n=1 Tax=Albula goreensis TaxID=1534307 RepID=A0A8T3CCK3_9TELE|nr:hypothetical protein AGOR_G00251660 [Albula goreensis]
MQSLFSVTLCCISLLSLQQQLLAFPTGSRLERNRSAFIKRLQELSEGENSEAGVAASSTESFDFILEAKRDWWRRRLSKGPPQRRVIQSPTATDSPLQADFAPGVKKRASRGRRHAHGGSRGHHHAQLMRVGCVLGTCQVQNLSHRLYQLIGQSGREDSSPMNPRSPHSYG